MIYSKPMPDYDYLHECFIYQDGCLIWKKRPESHFRTKRAFSMWNSKCGGKIAGRIMRGKSQYIQVGLDGIRYLAHRIILAMHKVEIPEVVDHINGDGLDNRLENLRAATQRQNTKNNSGWRDKAIRPGVFERKNGRFTANIRIDGKQTSLGFFDTLKDAEKAREIAEKKFYGVFSFSESRCQ